MWGIEKACLWDEVRDSRKTLKVSVCILSFFADPREWSFTPSNGKVNWTISQPTQWSLFNSCAAEGLSLQQHWVKSRWDIRSIPAHRHSFRTPRTPSLRIQCTISTAVLSMHDYLPLLLRSDVNCCHPCHLVEDTGHPKSISFRTCGPWICVSSHFATLRVSGVQPKAKFFGAIL